MLQCCELKLPKLAFRLKMASMLASSQAHKVNSRTSPKPKLQIHECSLNRNDKNSGCNKSNTNSRDEWYYVQGRHRSGSFIQCILIMSELLDLCNCHQYLQAIQYCVICVNQHTIMTMEGRGHSCYQSVLSNYPFVLQKSVNFSSLVLVNPNYVRGLFAI